MIGPWYVTTDWRRRTAWGDPCMARATAGLVVIDGRTFNCDRDVVEAFSAWEMVRAAHGYRLTGSDSGFYNCRHQNHDPDAPMSAHSWGRAFDVNWLENPAGNRLITDIPPGMVADLLAIKTNSGAQVLRWGADWDWDGDTTDHTFLDAMHWEVISHPFDLATGIDWSTVRTGRVESEEIEMVIRVTNPKMTGPAVKHFQLALRAWNPDALPKYGADGVYGAEGEEWTAKFQTAHKLPPTGVIDGVTAALLAFYAAPEGRPGPQGPAGPQGPPGPVPSKFVLEATVVE